MSRPKVTDYDRVKQFVAASDVLMLKSVRDLVDFATMVKGGTTPTPARKPRKAKDGAQPKLEGIT